jgi:hypothetical protein
MMRSTMTCLRCGSALPPGARYCATCGHSVGEPPASPPAAPGPAAPRAGGTPPRLGAFLQDSPLYGVLIEAGTFFLAMTYILKARGLGSARQLGSGVFDRTVMISRPP